MKLEVRLRGKHKGVNIITDSADMAGLVTSQNYTELRRIANKTVLLAWEVMPFHSRLWAIIIGGFVVDDA